MNCIKRLSILSVCCLCLSLFGQAQTARWQIKPEYQFIEPFAENIYKVKTYNDMSLINTSGETIIKADSITYLNNGYALALKSADDKYRLISIIDKNGQVTKVSQRLSGWIISPWFERTFSLESQHQRRSFFCCSRSASIFCSARSRCRPPPL